ncbi:MAG: glycine cleavage system aminomethyltransferase GcvT [Candidatus Sumerlaeota bacterium]|nr:glycine cleavage system aminomethyltransferase GcvT [Candidatus Sumerlaeota bacterium]
MNGTPLRPWHAEHGARLVDFAGWEMPLYFSAILEEHHAVRHAAGLFDICHMGRLRLRGPRATDLLQAAVTNDVARLVPGRACYALLCTASGGIVDDLIIYREDEGFLAIPNASNREAVVAALERLREEGGWDAEILDQTAALGMVALQGPASLIILQKIAGAPLDDLRRFAIRPAAVAGIECLVARTGYTGENGFEVIGPAERTLELWQAMLAAGDAEGIRPAGLGARDSLRIEAGYPLYGHELTLETDPLTAGLERFVKLDKTDFLGKAALLKVKERGLARALIAFEMTQRAVPRQGCVIERGGAAVGEVTSGLFSPTLNKGVGMGYVESRCAAPGVEIAVRIHNKVFGARVAARPLYRREA